MSQEHPTNFPAKKKQKFDISSHGGLIFGGIILFAIVLLTLHSLFNSRENRITPGRFGGGSGSISTWTLDDGGTEMVKTRETSTPELNKELDRVEGEHGLPDQVFQEEFPASENFGDKLVQELKMVTPEMIQRLRIGISNSGAWSVDPKAIQQNEGILDAYAPQRDRLREMLDNPETKFEQDLIKVDGELIPDDRGIDLAWGYLTLEEAEAAKCLEKEDIAGALKSLVYILKFSELASHTKFPVMRKQAAFMRENGLRILQTVVKHPKFGKAEAQTFLNLFHKHLELWPRDSRCWIGDRAAALRVFELLRRGQIDAALEQDELDELKRLDLLKKITWMKPKEYNADQLTYLKTMQTILDSCSQPFYQRVETLSVIDNHFKSLQGKPEYPAITVLMIRGIREGMQAQAEDKARVELWFLALATSLQKPVKEGAVDPVRGEKYVITRSNVEGRTLISAALANGSYKAEVFEY